ncbi:MAG: alpha/beta hydrolase [Candidatus Thorarchaeota archaeon]|jgi:alpha-beta hydrolase superfamily lysophospholipase
MKYEESHYIGFDGVKMHMSIWHPDDEKPRALLIAIHGLGSHGYTLRSIGEYFAERGIAVFAPDMRGFGHYSGLKGHVMNFDEYIEDMYNIVMQVKDVYLNKITFLFGHSLGGQHVIRYVATYPKAVDGMILSCPSVSVEISTPFYVVGKILSLLNVKRYFATERGEPTHDPEALKEMKEDPLGFDFVTPRFGVEGVKGAKRAMSSAPEIKLPAFVQQAGADKNVDPEKTKEFFEKLGSPDKTWRIYEGLYHGLHQELDKEMVFRDIESWLEKRLPT